MESFRNEENEEESIKEEKIAERLQVLIQKLEEKIEKTKPTEDKIIVNENNTHADPRFVVIHMKME